MQTDEIIDRVAERAGIDRHEAERAVHGAVLMLGRALQQPDAEDTAAQLPRELADHLRAAGAGPVEDDQDTLVTKMAEAIGSDGPTARARAGVALDVLGDALNEGGRIELLRHLPPAVTDLLPAS